MSLLLGFGTKQQLSVIRWQTEETLKASEIQ